MLRKIKNYFSGNRSGSKLSFVEQQVDTATAVIDMLDRAQLTGSDVEFTIGVGNVSECMVCRGQDSDAVRAIRGMVDDTRAYWVIKWREELKLAGYKHVDEYWPDIEAILTRRSAQERKKRAS
jgi:hypothetical protein